MSETRACTICGEVYPLTAEYFHKKNSTRTGFRPQCKPCVIAHNKEYYETNKETFLESQARYRKANKAQIADSAQRYHEANRARHKEYKRQYYLTNKARLVEEQRRYYELNRGRILKQTTLYTRAHREQHNIVNHKRRAIKNKLPNSLTEKQWEQLKQEFKGKCAYCGRERPLTQDHFIALNSGGEYTIDNIIPCCAPCNSSKGRKDFFDWYPKHADYSARRERHIVQHLKYKDGTQQITLAL